MTPAERGELRKRLEWHATVAIHRDVCRVLDQVSALEHAVALVGGELEKERAVLKQVRQLVAAMDEPMPPEPTHYFTRGLSSEPRPEFVAWEHRTHDAGKALRALLLSMARSARAET